MEQERFNPADFERWLMDGEWADEMLAELTEEYPNQWIAVCDQQVIGANEDMLDLINYLRRRDISLVEGEVVFKKIDGE